MKLSPGTRRRVDHLFPRGDRATVAQLLADECGEGLPSWPACDPYGLERVRYAAMKVARGDLGRLREAIALANRDWNGLLAAAQFDLDGRAHESWPGPTAPRAQRGP